MASRLDGRTTPRACSRQSGYTQRRVKLNHCSCIHSDPCPSRKLSHVLVMSWTDVEAALQLFAEYSCPWVRRAFGLNLSQFMDTLNVFALGSGAELVLRYPGANEELICE